MIFLRVLPGTMGFETKTSTGNVAFLECENKTTGKKDKKYYEEENIVRWVKENKTSPFTRAAVNLADIKILCYGGRIKRTTSDERINHFQILQQYERIFLQHCQDCASHIASMQSREMKKSLGFL